MVSSVVRLHGANQTKMPFRFASGARPDLALGHATEEHSFFVPVIELTEELDICLTDAYSCGSSCCIKHYDTIRYDRRV